MIERVNIPIVESSYCTGHFVMHLKPEDWQAYSALEQSKPDACSSLLHEYMHYLQDTATYYGALYRQQIYDNAIESDVKGDDLSHLFVPLFMGTTNHAGVRPTFTEQQTPYVLGSLAFKESMAQEAQRLAFGERTTLSCQAVYYRGIKQIIDEVLPYSEQIPYIRFCIEDCCLMTKDPSRCLLLLLQHLKTIDLVGKLADLPITEQIINLYSISEGYLESIGELMFDHIKDLDMETEEHVNQFVGNLAGARYDTKEEYIANYEHFMPIAQIIENHRVDNIEYRNNQHDIIAQTLYLFAKSHDMQTFYDRFGFPLIISNDDKGVMITNESDF